MTSIIPINDIILINGIESAVYFSKEKHTQGDLLIAQNPQLEDWYDVKEVLENSALKAGYTMYILTKHIK